MRIADVQTRQLVEEVVYESCLSLNAEDWTRFLALCDAGEFRYRIVNFSPEIRRDQCWMDRDWKGLKSILDLLPKHNSDHSPLTRHATVYKVTTDGKSGEAEATTLLAIYRTELDGANSHFDSGRTSLFAVGKYEDRIRIDAKGQAPKLLRRTVRLDTRQIGIGSHVPF